MDRSIIERVIVRRSDDRPSAPSWRETAALALSAHPHPWYPSNRSRSFHMLARNVADLGHYGGHRPED